MKIAQVAPLTESVPPRHYGGIERVVSYLTEELVRMGHEVTLFASGDSITQARLEAMCPCALRFDVNSIDYQIPHLIMLEKVFAQAEDFDIIHFHTGYAHFSLCRRLGVPHITTHHSRLNFSEVLMLFREFIELPFVSISNDQRAPAPWANWLATVYNGIPDDLFTFHDKPGDYLAFLGRISPEKRVDRAINIAKRAGMKIKIAAKVDKVDQVYFDTKIKPELKDPHVEYIGEISDEQKNDFLGNAYALMFPIDWPEPFGLVMIEAMACGTPIIAYRRGSVPEVIKHGVTGFIVDDIESSVAAVEQVASLDRQQCRREFDTRFTARHMTEKYLKIYHKVLRNQPCIGDWRKNENDRRNYQSQ